jgi:hypothetical protein
MGARQKMCRASRASVGGGGQLAPPPLVDVARAGGRRPVAQPLGGEWEKYNTTPESINLRRKVSCAHSDNSRITCEGRVRVSTMQDQRRALRQVRSSSSAVLAQPSRRSSICAAYCASDIISPCRKCELQDITARTKRARETRSRVKMNTKREREKLTREPKAIGGG